MVPAESWVAIEKIHRQVVAKGYYYSEAVSEVCAPALCGLPCRWDLLWPGNLAQVGRNAHCEKG